MASILPFFGNHSVRVEYQPFSFIITHQFSGNKNPSDYSWGGEDGLEETPLIDQDASEIVDRYAGTPSWGRYDFSAHYKLSPSMTVGTHWHNIFDTHYKEFASGISAPGRSLMLRVDYEF